MRRLLLILSVAMLPGLAMAAEGGKKFDIFGFYGLTMVSPADVNNTQKIFPAPKPSDITSGTSFGGGLGIGVFCG